MSDYSQINDYSAKDDLASGQTEKIILGSDIDAELSAISTAITSKFDSDDKNAASGIAPLDADTLVPQANLPDASLILTGVVELATTAETITGTDATRAVTPAGVQAVLDQSAGVLNDISGLSDPGADRIGFWDDSAGAFTWLTVSTGLTISATTLTTNDGAIVHDDLSGFISNEHINHTSVNLTAGTGLTGGGDISDDRTFNLDISGLTAIEGNGLASTDGFLVDNGGVMNRMSYNASGIRVQSVSGTSDTLATADMNTFIEYTNAGAVTVTLNTSVGVQGNAVIIQQAGAGQVTVSGTATLDAANGTSTRVEESVMILVNKGSDVWAVYGDTA